uniref:ShKT domain-containing protein n=1 Tax=Schistosoma curassoni TaxID=6186 RepID=A0A183L7E2_9TREM
MCVLPDVCLRYFDCRFPHEQILLFVLCNGMGSGAEFPLTRYCRRRCNCCSSCRLCSSSITILASRRPLCSHNNRDS